MNPKNRNQIVHYFNLYSMYLLRIPWLFSLFLGIALHQGIGQNIDRQILSNAYHSNQGEWVLGETIIGDFPGSTLNLNNGFLQGNLSLVNTRIWNLQNLSIEVFPNPFSHHIQIHNKSTIPLTIHVFDLQGFPVMTRKISDTDATLDLGQLPSGPYILKVNNDQGARGSTLLFKIN